MSILKDKDVSYMTLAESLKNIRKEYKLTQEDVAKLIGVSRSGYTYYETGKTIPSIEALKRLSAVYGVSIDYIVGNTTQEKGSTKRSADDFKMHEEKKDPVIYMKKDERTLIMAYRILSEKDKDLLKSFIEERLSLREDE
jgi:transcriptional regulator with XRE-family HTH domain